MSAYLETVSPKAKENLSFDSGRGAARGCQDVKHCLSCLTRGAQSFKGLLCETTEGWPPCRRFLPSVRCTVSWVRAKQRALGCKMMLGYP